MTDADRRRVLLRGALRLALLAGACAVTVSGLQALTAPRIEQQRRHEAAQRLAEVLGGIAFERMDGATRVALPGLAAAPAQVSVARRDGRAVAAVYDVRTPQGYSGDIRLLVGVDRLARVTAVRVVAHAETPGLGDRIELRRSGWIRQFDGRRLGDPPPSEWRLVRDGGAFDALTGASVTSRAVVGAVHAVLAAHAEQRDALFAPPAEAAQSAP